LYSRTGVWVARGFWTHPAQRGWVFFFSPKKLP
jgi:hypothetical protein